jgi:hypothetical protein
MCASYYPRKHPAINRKGKRPELPYNTGIFAFKSGHLLVSVTFIFIALADMGTNNSARRALTRNCITFRRRITEPHSITLGWIYPAIRAAVGGAKVL